MSASDGDGGEAPWRCLKLNGQYALFTRITGTVKSPLEEEEEERIKGRAIVSSDLRDFLQRCFLRK